MRAKLIEVWLRFKGWHVFIGDVKQNGLYRYYIANRRTGTIVQFDSPARLSRASILMTCIRRGAIKSRLAKALGAGL